VRSLLKGGNCTFALDIAIKFAYYIDMKVVNIAELKNNISKILSLVEKGEEIKVCKRNIPVAHLIPVRKKESKNQTKLGCGRGTVQILGDLTEPMIPENYWEMLKE